MTFNMKLITGKIKVVTGLHIGAGESEMHIGGTDNPVIKTADNEPYIPGSSLKGKMRSLLRLYLGGDDSDDRVVQLFGVGASSDKKNVKPSCLSFWDCFLTPDCKTKLNKAYTEIKLENTIDRFSGTSNNLRNTERVLPGAEFDFKLTVKTYDGEDVLPKVLGTMKLLEMDALGGSGSRGYGKIKFTDLKIDGQDIQSELDSIKPFENRFA